MVAVSDGAHPADTSDRGYDKQSSSAAQLVLTSLPGEILSQIASYLPLSEQIRFLSLHPALLSLCRTSLSPIPASIRSIVGSTDPYPALLARLPSLSLYTPDDGGRAFIELLVQARPKWIVESLEYGRWNESIWREAFERRFLRSWRRFKGEEDTWRAIFIRMLGRLEHRYVGCAHDENWTRFITLHRNGSASVNRIYSRTFDPYEIFAEFKRQNNFASQRTTVRVVLHLQDVRILAIGVLQTELSLFVNPNAHLLLHPPLLRDFASEAHDQAKRASTKPTPIPTPLAFETRPTASRRSSNHANEAYFPLVRTLSPTGPAQTTYGLGEPLSPTTSALRPSSPGLLSTFARVLPGRMRRNTSNGGDAEDRGIFRVRSRDRDGDDGRRRSRQLTRSRAPSISVPSPTSDSNGVIPGRSVRPITPSMPPVPELPWSDGSKTVSPPTPPRTPSPYRLARRDALPYVKVTKPQPHPTFAQYPNYTPFAGEETEDETPKRRDRRALHEEMEDTGMAGVYSSHDTDWPENAKMAEWDEIGQCRKRWVGPMLLVAQVHPPDRESALPPGASGVVEGDEPDLGHPGMYASFGYEDLEDLFPWIDLKQSGTAGESRRSGLGFE